MRRQSRRSVNICKCRKRSGVARVLVSQIVASSTRIRQMEIQAYFEEWSRRPGDTVRLAISTPHASIHASLVRLTSGPGQGDSIEGRVTDFSSVLDTTVPGRIQATMVGSYAELSLPAATGRLVSVHCWVWPTVPERAAPQAVWSLGDIALVTASGGIELRSKTNVVAFIPNAVVGKHWYSILVTIGDGELSIDLKRLDGKVSSHHTVRTTTTMTTSSETLILAASGVGPSGSPLLPFNGKIDSPTLYLEKPTADAIAAWHAGNVPKATAWAAWKLGEDFAAETILPTFKDSPPGRLVNGVERGVTGRNWDGRSDSFTETPQQYCTLQFHDDDMVDAGWSYDIEFALPDTLRSGVYAVRLKAGGNHTHFPLFVGPRTGMTAPVLFLIPTNTYLAYGNDHLASLDFSSVMPHDKVVPADEQYLFSHPEPGRSCYDTHADGTPVRYSSRRRSLFNVRPGFPNWLTGSYRHFPVDMYIVEWLEHVGIEYHVVTDEHLAQSGPRAQQDARRRLCIGGMVKGLRLPPARCQLRLAGGKVFRRHQRRDRWRLRLCAGRGGRRRGRPVRRRQPRARLLARHVDRSWQRIPAGNRGFDVVAARPGRRGASRHGAGGYGPVPIDGGGWVFSVGSITYGGALAWSGCDNGLSRLTANVLSSFASRGPAL